MKKPKFQLESLLSHKKQQEEDVQREHLLIKDSLMREEHRLSTLEYLREKSIIELQEKEDTDITLREIGLYYTFLSQISQEIENQKDVLENIKNRYEENRKELLELFKDKRSLEILKEREERLFKKEFIKREQKKTDDIAGKKYWKERCKARD
ncbi:MAG: flagellar export protein FliJ [Nitrospirota bacterium]